MTVSGTVSTTTFDIGKVIDTALRRCRLPSQMVTAEMQEIAKDVLYLLLSSWPGRGIQLWTIEEQDSGALTQGEGNITTPTGTIDVSAAVLRMNYGTATETDMPLARISQDDYVSLPSKTTQGRPVMYWLDRQRDVPVIRMWPVPDAATAANHRIIIYRQRHIMDVGSSLTATLDIPQRWYEALCWQLAWRLAIEIKDVPDGVAPGVKQLAEEAFALAQNEERDNSPIRLMPMISGYTR